MSNSNVKLIKIRLTPEMQDALSYLDSEMIGEMAAAAFSDIVAGTPHEEFSHCTWTEYAFKEAFYSVLYRNITVEDE